MKPVIKITLAGNVDVDPDLFAVATAFAWMEKWAEFAIVAVDTVIGNLGDAPRTDDEDRLLKIAETAHRMGVQELIFNRVEGDA